MLAYDYPLLGMFWTMMWFFLLFAWIILLFKVIADIFRTHDMGGFAKFLWLIFVVMVPFLGVFIYVLAHGRSMSEHSMQQAQAQQDEFQAYVRETAGTASPADQLTKLAALKDQGVITDAEFQAQKAKLLA